MTGRITTSARSYQMRYTQRARAVTPEVQRCMAAVGVAAMKAAKDLSSGPYSQAQLTRMGHPYSRKSPFPVGQDYPGRINVQTGAFRAAWRLAKRTNAKSVSVTIRNTDPKARKWLTGRGTRKMVGRPTLGMIARRIEPQMRKETRRVLPYIIGPPVGATGSGGMAGGVNLSRAFWDGFRKGQSMTAGAIATL